MKPGNKHPSFTHLIDLRRLEDVSDGNVESMRDLAALYVRTMDSNLLKIREALSQKRGDDAGRIAHSAVGASSLVGMNGVVPMLREIENLCERKEFALVPAVLKELETTYAKICDGLRQEGMIKGAKSA